MEQREMQQPPNADTQFTAIFSNVVYHGMAKRSSRVRTIFFIIAVVLFGVIQGRSTSPTAPPTMTLFFIGGANSIEMVIRLGEEREIGFSRRIGIFRVGYFLYIAAHVSARIAIALFELGLCLIGSTIFVPAGMNLFLRHDFFLAYIMSLVVGIVGTFAQILSLSILIKDPKVMPRAFPMIMSLITMYPTIMSFIRTSDSETTLIDWAFGALAPQGYIYVFYKTVLLQLNFQMKTILMLLAGQLFQTLVFIGIAFYIFTMTDLVVGRLGIGKKGTNSKVLGDALENIFDSSHNVLSVQKLTKRFGKFTALNNVDVDLHPGIITCLLGHNGAGKTTLINTVLGLEKPTSGQVLFNGKDMYKNPEVIGGNIGYCSADLCLFQKDTLVENMLYWAVILNVSDPLKHVAKLISLCNLTEHVKKRVKQLSGGTQKRVSLAMAMIGDPAIIFLDEPTSGVDVANREDVWTFISSMKREDRIILFTTHHLEEAEILTDDVIIMHKGTIDVRGSPNQLAHLYGTGYRFLILGLKDESSMKNLVNELSKFSSNLVINSSKFAETGTIEVTLPSDFKREFASTLNILNSLSMQFKIRANTLEDAFINRGEKKREELLKSSSDGYEELLTKRYKVNKSGIVSMLIKRQTKSIMGRLDTSLRYCYMIIMTPIFAVIFTSFFEFSMFSIVVYFGLFVFYSLVSGNIFMQILIEEKFNERRHLLKLIGVDSFLYVISMLVYDFILIVIALGISFTFFALFNIGRYSLEDIPGYLNKDTILIALGILVWDFSYILTAYNIAHFSWDTVRSLIFLPLFHVLTCIPLGLISLGSLALSVSTGVWPFVLVAAVLSPLTVLARIIGAIAIRFIDDRGIAKYFFRQSYSPELDILALLVGSTSYLILALYLDHRRTSFSSKGVEEALPQHLKKELTGDVVDQASIEQEEKLARYPDKNIPLQINTVSKRFKIEKEFFFALKDVSMVAETGQTVGLLGPNGAGKSTLFNLASTKYSIDYGRISANGENLSQFSSFYKNTGICNQKDSLWDSFTVWEHLQLWKGIYGIPDDISRRWLYIMELDGFEDFKPRMLSTGMKRKLCFLLSTISNPLYKFMDECTTGVDPIARNIFRDVIENQRKIYGATTIFTTHTMEEATLICNKLVILLNGSLCAIGTPESLVVYTKGFLLTVFVSEADKKESVKSIKSSINEIDEKTEIDESKVGQVIYRLEAPLETAHIWAEKLDVLVKESVISDYNLASQGLTDFFHKLSLHSKGRLGK